jgi:hypothetical protein
MVRVFGVFLVFSIISRDGWERMRSFHVARKGAVAYRTGHG